MRYRLPHHTFPETLWESMSITNKYIVQEAIQGLRETYNKEMVFRDDLTEEEKQKIIEERLSRSIQNYFIPEYTRKTQRKSIPFWKRWFT